MPLKQKKPIFLNERNMLNQSQLAGGRPVGCLQGLHGLQLRFQLGTTEKQILLVAGWRP